jgi:hypothetical protein
MRNILETLTQESRNFSKTLAAPQNSGHQDPGVKQFPFQGPMYVMPHHTAFSGPEDPAPSLNFIHIVIRHHVVW